MIATTIEQSKELVRLGLDPKTADCNWNTTFGDLSLCIGKNKLPHAVPAWSLSALLEVMSKVRCISYLTIDSSYLVRCKDLGFLWQKDIAAKDPITAAYEMVCYLLRNNLITNN